MHNSKKGKNFPVGCFFVDSSGKLKGTKRGKWRQIIEKDRRNGKKSRKEKTFARNRNAPVRGTCVNDPNTDFHVGSRPIISD